jgi:hypothetical protein
MKMDYSDIFRMDTFPHLQNLDIIIPSDCFTRNHQSLLLSLLRGSLRSLSHLTLSSGLGDSYGFCEQPELFQEELRVVAGKRLQNKGYAIRVLSNSKG